MADADAPPALADLIPTIESLPRVLAAASADLVASNFTADLAVVYAWDLGDRTRPATPRELAAHGLTAETAQPVALANLRARLPAELGTQGDGRSFLFTAGGRIEASLLLVPEVWAGLATQLAGDLVACVVARDVCLVTATGVPGGIASLVAARERIVAQLAADALISTTLLVRRAGAWAQLTS